MPILVAILLRGEHQRFLSTKLLDLGSVEEVCLIAVRPANGNDADCLIGFEMYDQHYQAIEKADSKGLFLSLTAASVAIL
ncbi:hypothetical protein ACCAA_50075 [Candidatus Accumulibacter aalborgensis]|uniref:Uncharacterized protein n=1 Tax=Candidatus Accumulibacter aalborgensis TaxID=1860102 RepID=A0A1A8XV34_9PROT|nr:hypothetical protein [Candidatus Accumulibacter aalborgensis]SBT07828.1 hypothetical protein ACCAA_50075 [Candidatus Accumulibacter aalborgensis]